MGGRAKIAERARARELRATGATFATIADAVGVSRGTVSVWVRDVAFQRPPRPTGAAPRRRGPNALERRKAAEIDELAAAGRARIGALSERDLLVAGTALYAGEGSKRDGAVCFSNSDPAMVRLFCTWLRHFFDVDESRLYLHEGLDIHAATASWTAITGIPPTQFRKPYRAVVDRSIRSTKHSEGVVSVIYQCSRTHRSVMGLVDALLGSDVLPG
jgi:hypothetical protein